MKTLKCSCGENILIDDDDYDELSKESWRCHKGVVYPRGGACICIARLIVLIPDDRLPDHINRNYHDNQKRNIRIATNSQNVHNSKINITNSTGYRGVCIGRKYWEYRLKKDGILHYKGGFKCIHEAAKAWNEKARELFGEFAFQNEIYNENINTPTT